MVETCQSMQGYYSDSAAVKGGVSIYKKVRTPIWGFIEAYYDDDYIFSLCMTEEISRGLKIVEEIELKTKN